MKKLAFIFLLLPVCLQAQGFKDAIFASLADTSSAVTIGKNDLFTGLIIPDNVNSDSLHFQTSRDGTTWYEVHDPRPDSLKTYYVKVDTTNAIYLPLDKEVFMGLRRLKVVLDGDSNAAADTFKVAYKDNGWF
jgi:hypothetical protein